MTSRMRLNTLERVCASIGLSLLVAFMVGFGVYLLRLPRLTFWILPFGNLACGAFQFTEIRRFMSTRRFRMNLGRVAVVLLLLLTELAMIRHFSAGAWFGDWKEHFDRSLFFLERWPTDTLFLNHYLLPARPPMMNVITALFMGLVSKRFETFQVIMATLNVTVLFSILLLLPQLGARHGRQRSLAALLFAASPFVAQNLTYSWTRMLCNFFVLAGVAFYLRSLRRQRGSRLVLAAVFFSAGILIHYSAVPYALVAAGHFLCRRQSWVRQNLKPVTASVLAILAILGLWFAFSFQVYGVSGTLLSTTTGASLGHSNRAELLVRNAAYSLVPFPVRLSPDLVARDFRQESTTGFFRDFGFMLYQQNFFFALGAIGGLAFLSLGVHAIRQRRGSLFWWLFFLLGFVVSTLTLPDVNLYGQIHVCGQPLVLAAFCLLIAELPRFSPIVRRLLVAGALFDYFFGVLFNFWLQSQLLPIQLIDGTIYVGASRDMISIYGIQNIASKLRADLSFYGDRFAAVHVWLFLVLVLCGFAGFWYGLALNAEPRRAGEGTL